MPCFLAISGTGFSSASRRIATICSSVNRVFFMAPSGSEGAILSSFKWSEKRQAGHDRPSVAEIGTAAISESIRAAGIHLAQEWDRVIAAFVRDQGDQVTAQSISDSTLDALVRAGENALGS